MLRRFLLAMILTGLATTPAWAEIARIKRAYGDAHVRRGTILLPAVAGQTLLEQDVLETGADGRISLAFIDDTRFSVGPKSRIGLAEFKYDETTHKGGHFLTTVDRGSLAIVSGQIAKEGKDRMRVRTPTSLLGVRGTRFVVQVD